MNKFLLVLSILSSLNGISQTTVFEKRYGGNLGDGAFDVVPVKSGGYAVFGSSFSFGNGGNDWLLVKTDENGVEEWKKSYGGIYNESGLAIIEGYTYGFMLAGTKVTGSQGDAYLMKVDDFGNTVWEQTYNNGGQDYIRDIIPTKDHGFVMSGFTSGTGSNGGTDMFVIKVDSSGTLEWKKTFGGTGDEESFSIIQTKDRGFACAGWTKSFGAGQTDFYVVKMDEDGVEEWSSAYGGTGNDSGIDILEKLDGGFIFCGGSWSYSNGSSDVWVINISTTGTLLWQKNFGGTGVEYARTVTKTNVQGTYAVAGYTESFGSGAKDVYLLLIDSLGNETSSTYYGGTGNEEAWGMRNDGKSLLIAGLSSSSSAGGDDFYFLKVDMPEPSSVTHLSGQKMSAFPNPFNNQINLKSEFKIQDVYLIDLRGAILFSQSNVNAVEESFDFNNFSKGVYFLRVVTAKGFKDLKVVKSN